MKPTANRLLVKVIPEIVPEVKEGETPVAKKGNEVMTAEVMACGPEVKAIKKGDVVVFSPFGFDEVEVLMGPGQFEKMIIICEEMILATK